MSLVVKNARRSPSLAAQSVTASSVGCERSDAPICFCSSGQLSASSPVPRWSKATMRTSLATGPSHLRARAMNGTPGSPGPPLRNTNAGFDFSPSTATFSSSVSPP